jgi:zinc-ribbon domain
MAVDERDQHEDIWDRARAAQRDEVHAVFAPRERKCPACGEPVAEAGRTCPHCGADLTARFGRPRWRRWGLVAAGVVALIAAVSAPIVIATRKDAASERATAARRQAALEAAERARLRRDVRPVRADGPALADGEDPVAHRAVLVRRAQELITEDARGRVAAGTINGDIKGTKCDPFPVTDGRRAAETDPATKIARYDCVAYSSTFDAGTVRDKQRTGYFGYPYWLVVDYDGSKLVWCKVTPRVGEGGRSLASVPVPPPCRDPAGPG